MIITSSVIAISLLVKNRSLKASNLWVCISICITIWGIGGYKVATTTNKVEALFWWQFSYMCVISACIFFTHFIMEFCHVKKKYFLQLIYLMGSIFIFFTWYDNSSLFLKDLRLTSEQFYWTDWLTSKSIIWIIFYIGFYWMLLVYAFIVLLKEFTISTGKRRNQIKYFILATTIGWLGAHGDLLSNFHLDVYQYANYCIALHTFIFAYAIIKYQLLDIRVAITRIGLFFFIYSIILGIPLWIGYHYQLWIHAFLLLFVFATIGPYVFNYLRKKTEQLLVEQHQVKLQNLAQEEQIRRHRAMDHFSSSLAHEIDNPMHSVSGLAEVIRLKVTEDLKGQISEQDQNYLRSRLGQLIKDSGRVSKMVKAIREFSSKTSGELTTVKIDEVIDAFMSIVGPQFKEDNITFEKKIEENIQLKGNKIHLEEVLMNLSINAIHAVNNNNLNEKIIHLRIYRNSPKTFMIELEDNGYGIKQDMLDDIFLDFVTTKASTVGIGMGLARVRKIVQNHKGKVWAQSDGAGKGGSFFVELVGG
ncbi:MAG: GHKL domain-containing protein [Candidatus Omnitrophica bacterium]|nr:GHKL domain-containing protein [Candidatus Omnitrophota bacterium]